MPHQFSSVRFVVNPRAVKRYGDVEKIIQGVLNGNGLNCDFIRTEARGHGTDLARQAADEGIDLVVAVGGDGTLNEVGRSLIGRETILGLLPCGSGNGFARAMGIPLDLRQACHGLLNAEVRLLDVGKIGGRIFFSNAGVGMDAEVSRLYADRPRGRYGFLTFVFLAISTFRRYTPGEIRIELDEGCNLRVSPMTATVANTSQYGYGATIAPEARPDDGLLNLCIIENPGLFRLILHAWRLFNGTIERMPGVRMFQTNDIRITRTEPGLFQVDGEGVSGEAVLEVAVMPGAIRIALPAGGIDG